METNCFFFFSSQNKLIPRDALKSYPRMLITLNSEPIQDLDSMAKQLLNQIVYINWPHFTEAKVVQIFYATKMFDGSSGHVKITKNSIDFNTYIETLNSK